MQIKLVVVVVVVVVFVVVVVVAPIVGKTCRIFVDHPLLLKA